MGDAFDVVVVGGGPAGAVCSAALAQRGLSTLVLEKDRFPRFHLGESLLPHSIPVLDAIGVLPSIDTTFLRKYGARFHDDTDGRKDRFAFAGAWNAAQDHAYQVLRAEFDDVLLRHARAQGVEVRERWTVRRARTNERGRVVGVDAVSPEGEATRIDARFVVDASGRDALFAHASKHTSKIEGLDQTAFYAHYEGVPRGAAEQEGDIDIVLFGEGTGRRGWFWVIPFKDGRTSVGGVVSRAWIKEQRASIDEADAAPALFARAVAASSTVSGMLANATMVWDAPRATADFSYRVADLFGDGWLAIGDAGGFIDPLFSSGAHIAMVGGKSAADLVADAGAAPDASALEAWAARMRAGTETFVLAVQAFYEGPLVEYLFADNKHTALRRSVTSLLAGDVFHDAVWLRDARRRLTEMLSHALA